jgi:hypothetical protein
MLFRQTTPCLEVFRPFHPGRVEGSFGLSILVLLAAGATHAQIDPAQFAPDPQLRQYSVYGTDSVHLPSQSGTASGGFFGSGGGIVLSNNARLRSPYVSAHRNFHLQNVAQNDSTAGGGSNTRSRINVDGRFTISGQTTFLDAVQVQGTLLGNGNDITYRDSVVAADIVLGGDRNDFYGLVQVRNTFATNNKARFQGAGYSVKMAGGAGTFTGQAAPANFQTNVLFPAPPPMGTALVKVPTELPGHTIAGYVLPGTRPAVNANTPFASGTGLIRRQASGMSDTTIKMVRCANAVGAAYCDGDTLKPGYYGNLNLNENGVSLLLGEGFYSFDQISIGSSSKIVAVQPNGGRTFVYSRGNISSSGSGSFIGPADAVGARGYGTGAGQFLGGTFMLLGGADITVPSDLTFWTTISAPHGDVILQNQVTLFGQVFAQRVLGTGGSVDFGTGAYIPFDPEIPVITIEKGLDITVREAGPSGPDASGRRYKDTVLSVNLSKANPYSVTVDWRLEDINAVWNNDYGTPGTPVGPKSGTLLIAKGSTSTSLTLRIYDDNAYEGSRSFRLVLDDPRNAKFSTGLPADTIGGTILDDELPPTVRFARATDSVSESVGTASFAVSLTSAVGVDLPVTIAITGGTATNPADYAPQSLVVTIPAGSLTASLRLNVVNDASDEPPVETALFRIASVGSSVAIDAARRDLAVSILDDDPPPTVSFSKSADSTMENAGSASVQIRLSAPTWQTVTVAWATTVGTASAADFKDTSGIATIPAGSSTVSVPVRLTNDALDELTEAFRLDLSSPTNATLGTTTRHDHGIRDDDAPPTVGFQLPAASGAESVGTDSVTVVLSGPSGRDVSVHFDLGTGSTATSGSDFSLTGATLNFPIGTTSRRFPLRVLQDLLDENNETVVLSLDTPVNASLATSGLVYTILDDDTPPTVAFALAAESGPESVGTDSIQVVLSAVSGLDVTVTIGLGTGSTAAAGLDFTTPSGTVTIRAGSTTGRFALVVAQDALDEPDETVALRLSAPGNATLGATSTSVYTILDDDAAPTVSFRLAASSGSEGVGTDSLEVFLSAASSRSIDVTWGLGNGSTATTGSDFVDPKGTLSFAPGQTSRKIPLTILQDALDELDETVVVALSAPNNASLGATRTTTYTIQDEDPAPSVGFAAATASTTEGVGTDSVEVVLSAPSGRTVSVQFGLGTGSTATAGSDFTSPSGSVSFDPGQTSRKFPLSIFQDALDELDETVVLALSVPSNASISRGATTITIQDDDAAPSVSVDTLSALEPASGSRTDSVVLRLSRASGLPIDVVWRTADASAISGLDYGAASPTTVRIDPGALLVKVPVTFLADGLDEFDESFRVILTSASNATLGRDTANVWIRDVDAAPSVSIETSVLVVEPATGNAPASFRVRLSAPSAKRVSVRWATSNLTATAGLDYDADVDSVVFLPGQIEATVSVQVLSDLLAGEGIETFRATLSGPSNATLGAAVGTGSIREGSGQPSLTITGNPAYQEADSLVTFRLNLSQKYASPIRVTWQTIAGTATAGQDFQDSTNVVVIPAESVSVTFQVRILDDVLRESAPETFQVRIVGDTNVVVATSIATDTILDDNDSPELRVEDSPDVVEGGSAVFRVTLAQRSLDTIRVLWKTVSSTATSPEDFDGTTLDTLVFLPGQTSQVITVPTVADSLWEPSESFSVAIVAAPGATLVDSTAVVDLLEEGPVPTLSWASRDTSVTETVGAVSLTATLSRPASVELSFDVSATGVTAAVPADAGLSTGRIVFPATVRSASTDLVVVDDSLDEFDETLDLALLPGGPVTLVVGDPVRLTILDDDAAPSVTFDGDTLRRAESSGRVDFVLRLERVSGKDVTVWIAHSGSATSGVDHDLAAGSLVRVLVPAGSTTATFGLGILDDRIHEPDETVDLTIDSIDNGRVGDSATLVILDDDNAPRVSFAEADTTVAENVGKVRLQLVLDRPSATPTSIAIRASGTTTYAGSGLDVVVDSLATVVFQPGDTVAWIEFDVVPDGKVEGPETLVLTPVSVSGTNGTPGDAVTVTIRDDDREPLVEIVKPVDSTRTRFPEQTVEWTWDKIAQTPFDTTLREGWNTLSRCVTDTAGNSGCDTIHVWGDFTPPEIEIFDPTTEILTNKTSNTVRWWVDDAGRRDTFQLDTTLAEGRHVIVRTACDDVGNCARDSAVFVVDLTPPVVEILTPPTGSVLPGSRVLLEWRVVDDGDTTVRREIIDLPFTGNNVLVRCAQDRAGNEACDTTSVVVQTSTPTKSWFIDTDGDGRVDAAIVEYPSTFRDGEIPEFSFTLGGETRTGLPTTGPVSGPSRGVVLRDKDGAVVLGKDGDTIWVAPGMEVRDSLGAVVRDLAGNPVVVPVGDTLRGPDGAILRDSQGRELFQVPGNGRVDSTRLLVPIVPPFAFGKTSVDSDSAGAMTIVVRRLGPTGDTLRDTLALNFPVLDSVAPVILTAEIRRTESYDGLDTLVIRPSEPLMLSDDGNWLEIQVGGRWVKVPAESLTVRPDGTILMLLPPGPDEEGSPSPGVKVRYRGGIQDSTGNVVDEGGIGWSIPVTGGPRPPRLTVRIPTPIGRVSSTESGIVRTSGFVLTATNGGNRDSFEPWTPEGGYQGMGGDSRSREICPDLSLCNGVEIEVNQPMRVQIFVYDLLGVHVGGLSFELTAQAIASMKPDQLDRYRIRVLWNQRGTDGRVVSSGIYPWRVVSWTEGPVGQPPRMANEVVRMGVKARLE